MRQDILLSLEAQLLIARYGRQRVLETLAAIGNVDLAAVQREIETYRVKSKNKRSTRKKNSVKALLGKVNLNEDTRSLVEKIAYAYDNKEFLPELRKVRRFLEAHGVKSDKLRSRADALPKIINLLARQSSDSLEKLVVESETTDRSDLGLIADQILGHGVRPSDGRMSGVAEPGPLQYAGSRRKPDDSSGGAHG